MPKRSNPLEMMANFLNLELSELESFYPFQLKDIANHVYEKHNILNISGNNYRCKQKKIANNEISKSNCQSRTYVDILYIPLHPVTQKMMVLMLTETALEAVKFDCNLCKKAVMHTSAQAIVTGLADLGVLSVFNCYVHESFLDKKNLIEYRYVIAVEQAMRKALATGVIWFPKKEKKFKGFESIFLQLSEIELETASLLKKPVFLHYELQKIVKIKLVQLQKKNIKTAIKLQRKYEKKAQKKALKTTIKGLKNKNGFAYFTKNETPYYTDLFAAKSYRYINKLIVIRRKLNIYINESESLKIFKVETASNFYKEWIKINFPVLNQENIKTFNRQKRKFILIISKLNQHGFVIKEQVLSYENLYRDYFKIDLIDEETNNLNLLNGSLSNLIYYLHKVDIENLGYYPCYKLELILKKTIKERLAKLKYAVLPEIGYKSYIKQLLEYIKLANIRRKKIRNHAIDLGKKNDLTLIFHENRWYPDNYNHLIQSQSKENDLFIIEASLASSPNEIIYLRSNNPVLSKKNRHNKLSVLKIYEKNQRQINLKIVQERLIAALAVYTTEKKYYFKKNNSKKLLGLISIDSIFPWTWDRDNIFGTPILFQSSTGAQLFRFVHSGNFTSNKISLYKTLNERGISLDSQINLMQAKHKLNIIFPDLTENKDNKLGVFSLPCLKRRRKKDGSYEKYLALVSIGWFRVVCSIITQGTLSVSLSLGSGLQLLQTKDGGLNVQGKISVFSDNNKLPQDQLVYEKNAVKIDNSVVSCGAAMHSQLFAGLQAGGIVNLKIMWRSSLCNSFQDFLEVSAGFSVEYGFREEFLLLIAVKNNKLYFKINFAAAIGPGFGGIVGFVLSPYVAEEFCNLVLEIAAKDDFCRFNFFAKEKSEDAFSIFNQIITFCIITGLSVSQALLLSVDSIMNFEKNIGLYPENSFYIAGYIIKLFKSNDKKIIRSLLPESLARILKIICRYHICDNYSIYNLELINNIQFNFQQQQALVLLLANLIKQTSKEKSYFLFENAMQRMHLKVPEELKAHQSWPSYTKNIISIYRNFTDFYLNRQVVFNFYKKNNQLFNINISLTGIEENYVQLKKYFSILTQKSPLWYKCAGVDIDYIAIPQYLDKQQIYLIKDLGFKPIEWDTI